MGYLFSQDYLKQIQESNLTAIISATPSIQYAAEAAAQEECISFLVQKYDTSLEFQPTTIYNPSSAAYLPNNLVYLFATAFNPASTYALGALVLYTDGNVYVCSLAVAVAAPWNPANWTVLGALYALFFPIFPKPVFDFNGWYNYGDQVYWRGKIYASLQTRIPRGHDGILQYYNTKYIPLPNSAPDDPVNGPNNWQLLSTYSVPAGALLNPTYWTAGDCRSQLMVQKMVDITLYHLHCRIAPRNVPEPRIKRYDDAISWLRNCAKGKDITAPLPRLQPPQGNRVRFGSNIKNFNGY